ncbi:hypothetical protein [Spirosoma pollinicola]|uniref:Uncharacterized protein n=1 Tax=Spirosoma pollinicola TaxID=2057025 RepID=A0A2K8Z9U5_9BACT|nr:hypothetical protein [Spirosoma pollinicola]AUD06615.1 hypothetical protein CWM47_35070 [Spirosoma pollinicola]
MNQDEYSRLVINCKDEHKCLLFQDDSIASDQVAMFVPSRAFTLSQLKAYLIGFGLTEAEVRVVPLQQRPKNAPFGGYVVTIPLPEL